jgi:hypothetical protein
LIDWPYITYPQAAKQAAKNMPAGSKPTVSNNSFFFAYTQTIEK